MNANLARIEALAAILAFAVVAWAAVPTTGPLRVSGSILGSFTDTRNPPGKVYFIRIKADLASVRIVSSSYDRGAFSAEFTDLRGQPESIHFGVDGNSWSEWHAFSSILNVSIALRPLHFQLRSRLGVESEVFVVR